MIKKSLMLSALAVAISGCSTTIIKWPDRQQSSQMGVYSRHVAFMPYTTQGVDVKPVGNWYYGETKGMKAYAVEGGIVYVDAPESPMDKTDKTKTKQKINTDESAAANTNTNAKTDTKGKNIGNADGADNAASSSDIAGHGVSGDGRIQPGAGVGTSLVGSAAGNGAVVQKDNAVPANVVAPVANEALLAENKKELAASAKSKVAYFDQIPLLGKLELIVNFPLNKSDQIYPESEKALGDFLTGYKWENKRAILIGYTDDIGLDDFNIPFSGKRAEFVKSKMLSVLPADKIAIVASGPSPRAVDNRIEDGRKLNRRVEIFIVDEK